MALLNAWPMLRNEARGIGYTANAKDSTRPHGGEHEFQIASFWKMGRHRMVQRLAGLMQDERPSSGLSGGLRQHEAEGLRAHLAGATAACQQAIGVQTFHGKGVQTLVAM